MDRKAMVKKLQEIIESCTDIPADDITETSSIVDDLELSSLEVLMVMGKVEDELGVCVPEKDFLKIETFGDIVDKVSELL